MISYRCNVCKRQTNWIDAEPEGETLPKGWARVEVSVRPAWSAMDLPSEPQAQPPAYKQKLWHVCSPDCRRTLEAKIQARGE